MKKLGYIVPLSLVLALLYAPYIVYGQTTAIPTSNIRSKDDISSMLNGWLRWVLFDIVGVVAVGAIVYSAILFMTAGDNDTRRKNARQWLIYGVIGIVVAVLSYTMINIVSSFLQK